LILDEIFVESKRVNKNTVKSTLQVPDRIKKYIKTHELFVTYDKEITDKESILNIPLVSNVLPLAWLTDSDIRVDSLDKRYRESMYALKEEINKIFPVKQYKTNINAGRIVENKVEAEGTGLLFSGGVDSTYSLISNWSKKPHLIMVWGIDMHPYPEYAEHWNQLESIYSEFAQRNGLTFNMIKTNASQIMNYPRIDHDFHRALQSSRLRLRHQHSLIVIPLVAPFSLNRFDELLFAASYYPRAHTVIKRSGVTIPKADERIVWADLETKHDGFIPRIDKLHIISDFINKQDIVLKPCQRPELNCGYCFECQRTIMYFALQGIDPNRLGFKVNEDTFENMKRFYESRTFSERSRAYFEPIKRMIPEKIDTVFEGSKSFFEWFFEKDLYKNVKKDYWSYRVLYNWLPFSLASIYDRVLSKTRIRIHPGAFDVGHFPRARARIVVELKKSELEQEMETKSEKEPKETETVKEIEEETEIVEKTETEEKQEDESISEPEPEIPKGMRVHD
jgi:hypothetical protein